MNIEEKSRDIANEVRRLQTVEADQAATLKATREEIRDLYESLVAIYADDDRPLLEGQDGERVVETADGRHITPTEMLNEVRQSFGGKKKGKRA